jgi:hypothetical protein
VSLQRRGECGEREMTSREGEERGRGVLSTHDGLDPRCTRWKQLEGLGGVLGTALWS